MALLELSWERAVMAGAKRSCDQWEGAVIDLNVSPMVVLNIHHLQNRLSFFFLKFRLVDQLPLIHFLVTN